MKRSEFYRDQHKVFAIELYTQRTEKHPLNDLKGTLRLTKHSVGWFSVMYQPDGKGAEKIGVMSKPYNTRFLPVVRKVNFEQTIGEGNRILEAKISHTTDAGRVHTSVFKYVYTEGKPGCDIV